MYAVVAGLLQGWTQATHSIQQIPPGKRASRLLVLAAVMQLWSHAWFLAINGEKRSPDILYYLFFPEVFIQIQFKNTLTWQHLWILSWNRCELFSSLHGVQRSLPNVRQPGIALNAFHCCDLSSLFSSLNTWGVAEVASQRNILTGLTGEMFSGGLLAAGSVLSYAELCRTPAYVSSRVWHSPSVEIFWCLPTLQPLSSAQDFAHFILQ